MKITCANCQVELLVEENGVMVLEMFEENKEVYKVWFADIWYCPECETRILVNPSTLAAAQHHEKEKMDNYEKMSHDYAAKGKLYHIYERGKFRE